MYRGFREGNLQGSLRSLLQIGDSRSLHTEGQGIQIALKKKLHIISGSTVRFGGKGNVFRISVFQRGGESPGYDEDGIGAVEEQCILQSLCLIGNGYFLAEVIQVGPDTVRKRGTVVPVNQRIMKIRIFKSLMIRFTGGHLARHNADGCKHQIIQKNQEQIFADDFHAGAKYFHIAASFRK